jgi:trehalose 6-phosphate phosphatase
MKTKPESNRATDIQVQKFFSTFATAKQPLLLLDYDGTLAPFRVDRFKARPWAGVRELLNRIQNPSGPSLTSRLVFISGRPGSEIGPLLGVDKPVEVWGLHGAERIYADGRRELEEPPPATSAKLEELRAQLRRDSFGGLFEDKPNAVVMHWRGASGIKAREIAEKSRALFEPLAHLQGLKLLEFESGLELRTGRDKGGAVEAILTACGDSSEQDPVAFLGDDITDEAAFIAVNACPRPHITALVKRVHRETAAAVWLQPPGQLRAFLRQWIGACKR